MNNQTAQDLKHIADALSIANILATLTAWLPPVAALVSIAWGLIRVYETRTVQKLLGRRPRTREND